MKVSELEQGMMIEPAGDNEVFLLRSLTGPPTGMSIPYITVRGRSKFMNMSAAIKTNRVMYLGNRRDVNVTRKDFGWSNRFVLVDGIIAAVDPSSWVRIRRVQ